MLRAATVTLTLSILLVFTPMALASGNSGPQEPGTGTANLTTAAAADPDSSSAPAAPAASPDQFTQSQSADNTQSQSADNSSSSVNSNPGDSTANNAVASAGTSNTVSTASHEGDGDGDGDGEDGDKHDYKLQLTCSTGTRGTYWASREDYDAHLLSIDYSLENIGTGKALNVQVTDATASTGVTVATTIPLELGDLDPGDLVYFTLKWLLPRGVGSFTTEITACADDDKPPLDDDKPPVDDDTPLKPPGDASSGGNNGRLTQDYLSQYGSAGAALPSTGFTGLNIALLAAAGLACGLLLTLWATAASKSHSRVR